MSSAKASGCVQREQPGVGLVGRAVTGDHVGRDCPGRAAKAEQRLVGSERRSSPGSSVSSTGARRSTTFSGRAAQPSGVIGIELRTFPGLEANRLAQGIGDDEDVGKKDRGIELEPPQRLQRYFGSQFGRIAKIEKAAGLFPHRTIFGQIAAGLPHDPDRRTRSDAALGSFRGAVWAPGSQSGPERRI